MNIQGGITGLIIGPAGTGKSTLLGSAGEIAESPLLLAPKPREINSFMYRKYDIPYEIFTDEGWHPVLDQYEATGFRKLYSRVVELMDDEKYDFILLDPFTDVVTLIQHYILMPQKVGSVKDLQDSMGFFGTLKDKLKEITQALVALASPSAKRPKHVFVAVHAQALSEFDIKGKATRESKAKGKEFLGDVVAMILGGYRLEIPSEFDIVGYSGINYENEKKDGKMVRTAKYEIQLNADPTKHAKVALIPRMEMKTLPNEMKALFDAIEKGMKG